MKTTMLLRSFVFSTSAVVAFFLGGCATPPEHSFNDDFHQNLTAAPKFFVEDENSNAFKITVHQGEHVSGQARIIDVKLAASTVAENEARKRGWKAWDVNYVRETDQGWMHEVIAEVTPKMEVQFTAPPATNAP